MGGNDSEFEGVLKFFLDRKGFETDASVVIRRALDDVIDGLRTGRWSVDSLEKTEKTYIGTKVEILLRFEFELGRGEKLDVRIADQEVDIKCTVRGNWMIPREAIGEICLLVRIDDVRSKFWIGLIRANEGVLTSRSNQDKKKSLAFGKVAKNGVWIVCSGDLPKNVLIDLDPESRDLILTGGGGMSRLVELFRRVQGKVISRVVLETVARQKDPMRRFRQARDIVAAEGIEVLHGQWLKERSRAKDLGVPSLQRDECIAFYTRNRTLFDD